MANKFFYIKKKKKEKFLQELRAHASVNESDITEEDDHIMVLSDVARDLKHFKVKNIRGDVIAVIFYQERATSRPETVL